MKKFQKGQANVAEIWFQMKPWRFRARTNHKYFPKFQSSLRFLNPIKLLKEIEIGIVVFALTTLFIASPIAYGDQAFHTKQLRLVLTAAGQKAGFPELTTGHVLDIHANGPRSMRSKNT